MKGPSGRQMREADLSTTATATLVDSNRNGSATRLVTSENEASRESGYSIEASGMPQNQ